MPNHPARPRRDLRTTLIEPFKQIKLGLYVFGICLAFIGFSGFLFVAAFMEQYQHVMGIFQVVDPNLRWELVTNDVFYKNAVRVGLLFATFITVLFTVIFRMTHRVYGPLVSIERFVAQMAAGKYNRRVVIRSGDELQRLVSRLNDMAASLEKRHGSNIGSTDEIPEDDDYQDVG